MVHTITRTPGMVNIYKAYRNVPTQNADWLRTVGTVAEALDFRALYEGANHFGIAVYEVDADGMEDLRYSTERGVLDIPTK